MQIIFFMSILLFGLLSVSASAETGDFIQVEAANYSAASANISISRSGIATVNGIAIGKHGITTQVSMHLYLQKYKNGSWTTVRDWTGSKDGTSYSFTKNTAVSKGKYRTNAVIKVYAEKRCEKVKKYSGNKLY